MKNHHKCQCYHDIKSVINVLDCQNRWRVIKILATGEKSTREISKVLCQHGKHGKGHGRNHHHEKMCGPNLYYHLNALKKEGIIAFAGYKEPEGGGAPEKIWKLKKKKIVINLENFSFDCQCEDGK